MHVDPTVIGHPTQRQLVEFAESLVDRGAPVSALMAAHVANCPVCAGEVKHIRASLELAALACLPEPSGELTHRIITRARQQRLHQCHAQHHASRSVFVRVSQIAACLAATVALAYVSFSAAMNDMNPKSANPLRASVAATEASPVQGLINQQTASVQALSAAVALQHYVRISPFDMEHRRSIEALNYDMSAARAALERNPGCIRANQVMIISVEQQLEGLRNLYLDRKL